MRADVKEFFDQADQYLNVKGSSNIQLRAEVVADFVSDQYLTQILDIGCGDGTISLPLLQQDNQLTLLDISNTMLSIASSRIPPNLLGNVQIVNEDFMLAELHPQNYDLILCLGVLAHVDSPTDVIAKMVSLLKPNGTIIVQNSDAQHPVRYLSDLYLRLRNLPLRTHVVSQRAYTLNQLSTSMLVKTFRSHGLSLTRSYRYNMHIPGMGRLFPDDAEYNKKMHNIVRKIYGSATNNRFSILGTECIFYFKQVSNNRREGFLSCS
jgi:2-polyprenyl-3-methyl-5-hydroxy-6-metoxy-1,4-benzoquinol methylase